MDPLTARQGRLLDAPDYWAPTPPARPVPPRWLMWALLVVAVLQLAAMAACVLLAAHGVHVVQELGVRLR